MIQTEMKTCECHDMTCEVCGVEKHPACRRYCEHCHGTVGRFKNPPETARIPYWVEAANWGTLISVTEYGE